MALSRLTRPLTRGACALAVMACISLMIASAATAHIADTPQPVVNDSPVPVVKETIVQPSGGPHTLALVLIGIGAAAAMLGAGYLGGRIAIRTSATSRTEVLSASSSAPARRRRTSRTGA